MTVVDGELQCRADVVVVRLELLQPTTRIRSGQPRTGMLDEIHHPSLMSRTYLTVLASLGELEALVVANRF